eukprot:m.35896 g.35896  ORF g.35896 m.35896 type:complete len:347 (+) comp7503_c0_seq1:138-1178(+)
MAEQCDATGDTNDVCRNECNTITAGQCTCAFAIRNIPPGGSCTTVCQGFAMTCSGRHSDAGSDNRCAHFDAGVLEEQCDATGDDDDVCICSKPSASPALPTPTSIPTTAPTTAPMPPTLTPISESPTPTPTKAPSVTSAPTPFPTTTPTAVLEITGCGSVVLTGYDDAICRDECNTITLGECSCAFALRNIPPGGSCITVCHGFDMICVSRHSDASSADRCAHFTAGINVEQCDATGDDDDVCVCSKPVSPEAASRVISIAAGPVAAHYPNSEANISTATVSLTLIVAATLLFLFIGVTLRLRSTQHHCQKKQSTTDEHVVGPIQTKQHVITSAAGSNRRLTVSVV